MKRSHSISITCFAILVFSSLWGHSAIITTVSTAADATIFPVSPTDNRVNVDLNRIGGNNGGTIAFESYHAFDLAGTGLTVAQLQASTFDLVFTATAQDNAPALDDLQYDYLGTFAQGGVNADYGANGVNGASAFAIALEAAPVVTALGSNQPALGVQQTINADAIAADTFANQFAIFRFSDPSFAAHQFDIAQNNVQLVIDTPIPEPS